MSICYSFSINNFNQIDLNDIDDIETPTALHSGKVHGQIWTFLKLKLEVRGVLNKPKGLKVAKEELRLIGSMVDRIGLMVNRDDGQ